MIPGLMYYGEELTMVDPITYLSSCVTKGGRTIVEVSTRLSKVREVYAELKHLRNPDFSTFQNRCVAIL